MLTMRPTCMFRNLRYLTCELIIFTGRPNCHSGLLQLVRYLEFSPQLEVLQLHVSTLLVLPRSMDLKYFSFMHYIIRYADFIQKNLSLWNAADPLCLVLSDIDVLLYA